MGIERIYITARKSLILNARSRCDGKLGILFRNTNTHFNSEPSATAHLSRCEQVPLRREVTLAVFSCSILRAHVCGVRCLILGVCCEIGAAALLFRNLSLKAQNEAKRYWPGCWSRHLAPTI